jgi:hypothetical protein
MSWPIPSQPDFDPDGWPGHDDQAPGVPIRPLSQADLAAILDHADHDQADPWQPARPVKPIRPGRPMVAVRVRASVGRPGASAHAQYRHRRAGELAAWHHGLPWRLAAVLTAGTAAGLLAARISGRLTLLTGLAAAAAVGWQLQFRPSRDTKAWQRGAAGERRTARQLRRLERDGWAILHDLAIPARRPTSTTWPSAPAESW